MRVALKTSLYMMRYGLARLAAFAAHPTLPRSDQQITLEIVKLITRKKGLDTRDLEYFVPYLQGKPGSPKYTPLRRALKKGELPLVEQQDLWLAEPSLSSSVGALTKNYYDDPVKLAKVLGLLGPRSNQLLSRGLLSRYSPDEGDNPFLVPQPQRDYMAFWLLDADGDWLWAFLSILREYPEVEIDLSNRVDIFMETLDLLLKARHLSSGSGEYLTARRRLIELQRITRRNQRDGLNLGQPWSWFLIPRLELCVDAGFLTKRQPSQLSGYTLSRLTRNLQKTLEPKGSWKDLANHYFGASGGLISHSDQKVDWPDVREAIEGVVGLIRSPMGYYPLFEAAVAVCGSRGLTNASEVWEIIQVEEAVRNAAKGDRAEVTLGIDRKGRINNFRLN